MFAQAETVPGISPLSPIVGNRSKFFVAASIAHILFLTAAA
jgi:hypothetical protein